MATARRAFRLTALAAALLFCLIPHLLWRALGRRSPWPRRFLGLAARAVGARVRTEGHVFHGDSFIIANHVSWVDILALGGATGATFVAHDGIAAWPLVGWLAAQNNTLFVARDRRGALTGQIDALRAALAGHQPVVLFPEGTTGDGRGLLPFKPSLLAVLLPPPRAVMVQPVHIDYGAATTDIAWHSNEPAGTNMKRLLERAGRLDVTLRFLEPLDPMLYPDRKKLAAVTSERIGASIGMHQPPFAPAQAPV